MCQSKANGGRRCTSSTTRSNYPHWVNVTSDHHISLSESEENPEKFLHAAVLSARTGYPLDSQSLHLAQASASLYSTLSPAQRWRQWRDLALAEHPSAGLQALYAMGWEQHFPALQNIRGVPQSPLWHPEGTVDIHTGQAADVAAQHALRDGLSRKDREIVVLAAICHDFGKATHTFIEDDGRLHSRGHDVAGVPIAQDFLKSIHAPQRVIDAVVMLVGTHMSHANKPTRKSVRKLIRRLDNNGRGATLEQWMRLAEADTGGRGAASSFAVYDEWNNVYQDVLREDS